MLQLTDIEKIAENEIEENENSVDFDEDVIDGEATDIEQKRGDLTMIKANGGHV